MPGRLLQETLQRLLRPGTLRSVRPFEAVSRRERSGLGSRLPFCCQVRPQTPYDQAARATGATCALLSLAALTRPDKGGTMPMIFPSARHENRYLLHPHQERARTAWNDLGPFVPRSVSSTEARALVVEVGRVALPSFRPYFKIQEELPSSDHGLIYTLILGGCQPSRDAFPTTESITRFSIGKSPNWARIATASPRRT